MSFQGYIKADTEIKVVIGPVVAVGDGFTPVTNLAVSTSDEAEILKHNAAAVTDISANTFAAIASADGYYNLTITAGQLDTEGMLTVLINDDSLCLPVNASFMVQNANVYDSLNAAATTDYLQVDVAQWLGTAAATPTTAGVPEVDVTHWIGAAAATPTVAGVPEVDITHWLGTAVTANIAGQPTVDVTRIGASTQSLIDLKDFVDTCYDPTNNKVQSDLVYLHGTALTESVAGYLAAAFVKLFDVATPLLVASEVMRGTDSAYTGTPPTAEAIVDEWESQAQTDPTGFHVNVLEIAGTAQTANDNGADINAILTDTDELQGDWVDGGRLDLIQDIIAADTTTDIPALIAALENISAADVNTQVSDVIKTDTISEMAQGAPAATPTLEDAIMYLYMYFRNEVTQTATTLSLKNDGGTVITKSTVSDDTTTFTKGEMVSGP